MARRTAPPARESRSVTHIDDDLDEYDLEYEEEYEDLRPQSSRGRRIVTVLAGIVLVLALVAAVGALWLSRQINPSGASGPEVQLTVPTGSSTSAIATLL